MYNKHENDSHNKYYATNEGNMQERN